MSTITPRDIEVLASGYQLAEAPRVAADGSVYFTDALGGGVYRWQDRDGEPSVETVVAKRRGVGGLVLHEDGGLVIPGRDLIHHAADGTDRTIWTLPDGVLGTNDCCALADGSILIGVMRWRPFADPPEQPVPGEFVRIGTDGDEPRILFPLISWVNGCGVDIGRGRTYACDYDSGTVWLHDGDGVRIFAQVPGGEADGLAVDHQGGVWVATARGGTIVALDPDSGAVTSSLEFGGIVTSVAFDGGNSMIVTTAASRGAEGALLRLSAPVPGPRHLTTSVR